MEELRKLIYDSEQFRSLALRAKGIGRGQPLQLRGVSGSLMAFVAARVFESVGRQLLLIGADEERAEKLRDDCVLLLGEASVRYFGARPVHLAQSLDISASIAQVETLKALAGGGPTVTVASPKAIAEHVPDRERFKTTIVEVRVGEEHPFTALITRIEQSGFVRKDFVESYGDIAVRGGIVDVFPFVGDNPVRLEFYGDRVESIREFDVLSQRSIRELHSASIIPDPAGATGEQRPSATLFDYLQPEAIVILDEPEGIRAEIDELFKEGATGLLTFDELRGQANRYAVIGHSSFSSRAGTDDVIDFASTPQPAFNGSIKLLVDQLRKFGAEKWSVFLTCDTPSELKRLRELIEEEEGRSAGSHEGIEDGTRDSADRTHDASDRMPEIDSEMLDAGYGNRRFKGRSSGAEGGAPAGGRPASDLEGATPVAGHGTGGIGAHYTAETLHSGFLYPSAKLAVISEHEIFNRLKRRGAAKRRRFRGFSQKEFQALAYGDFVVHIDYGIGEFSGLKKIKVGGIEQEVMKLQFAEEDALYVNLNFINRVQKYSSQEGHVPKLSKLGGAEWEKAKARAKRRIKDIARDIIALYAKRKLEKGFAFSPDSHWQKELEASFMYEDTADQAKATSDVKNDMESASPMDRLICGDVGFGKTEVAVRAAFKAVMDGKQVALLVPTTILALQHYHTFLDRLARYTTRVENITRFKSKAEQQKIVEGLRQGSVDIVIGTHRLLSKDIAFKDLGLLIIDEEHRFGVAAKEKLRRIKAAVDTLALTATPIPRTLHFSLIGARDLSLIATAPRNRIPIATEIIPSDAQGRQLHWQVIREAILKELHRGGQAYVVHDRVHSIESVADLVKQKVPEAKVHIAHGQMSGHELEKTMLDFLEKKYDVLVCTKIIESGLDIPSVNTIIVNRADMFGLAELYQLRGRVGRSNIQAYAYLLTPPLSAMPKTTLRRLQAIEEFTELGSGFNLAMRDLEIRGAGNLLGGEQSGFIMEMGFEMYERIVREAVDELRSEEFRELFEKKESGAEQPQPRATETVIDADIPALIPDFYIESDAERLDVYRRLYRATAEEELGTISAELRDRFGEYPGEVGNLFQLIGLRLAASRQGFRKVSLHGATLSVVLPEETDEQFYGKPDEPGAPFQKFMKRIAAGELRGVQLKQEGKNLTLRCALREDAAAADRMKEAKNRIGELVS